MNYVLGDARLTLANQPQGVFDILLIDAFSSDAVPTHLLTVQAAKAYLGHLKPDGVLILHLSNRNLDLNGPAQAVAKAAGGVALIQHDVPPRAPGGGPRRLALAGGCGDHRPVARGPRPLRP